MMAVEKRTLPVDSPAHGAGAKASTLSILGRLGGAIGLVLLASMILTWILTQTVGVFLLGKLVIGLSGVVFYLATNADFFRKVARGRSAGLLIMTGIGTSIVLGLVGVANYIVFQNPSQWDLTREGIHTLSPQTTGVLNRLDKDVKIFAFYSTAEPVYPLVADVLGKYHRLNSRVQFEVVDPQSRPDLVKQYQITDGGARLVVTAGEQDARANTLSEEEVTQAIIKVAEETTKTFYYMTGHGEPELTDAEHAEGYKSFAEAVTVEGYNIRPLSFLNPEKTNAAQSVDLNSKAVTDLKVADEVSYIIIAGPQNTFLKPEIEAVADFIARGGRLLVLVNHAVETGVEKLLGEMGIDARNDLVVDPNPLNRMIGLGPAAPMVIPTDEPHPITEKLKVTAVMSTARSLGVKAIADDSELEFSVAAIMRAGESAWGETNLEDGMAEQDETDTLEDIFVAVAATAPTRAPDARKVSDEARVIAFGDSDWLNNQYLSMQGNKDLILNTLNWLAQREDRITVRPAARDGNRLEIYGEELNYLKFFSMDIVPVLLIAMGLGIVLIRRQR